MFVPSQLQSFAYSYKQTNVAKSVILSAYRINVYNCTFNLQIFARPTLILVWKCMNGNFKQLRFSKWFS